RSRFLVWRHCLPARRGQPSEWCSVPVREIERARLSLRPAPNVGPSPSRAAHCSRVLSILRRRNRLLLPPVLIRLNAVRCCWQDVQPAGKHNRFPERPAAVVSVPTLSAAKTQADSAMAIRSDLMRPPVFVAQPLAEQRETRRMREARPGEIDSQASRIPLQYLGRIRQPRISEAATISLS